MESRGQPKHEAGAGAGAGAAWPRARAPGGLAFAERLASLGARVAVPTTLNANSVDRRRWRALGVPGELGEPAEKLGDAYLRMGCDPGSFTCAPYLLDSRPLIGEQATWSMSARAPHCHETPFFSFWLVVFRPLSASCY